MPWGLSIRYVFVYWLIVYRILVYFSVLQRKSVFIGSEPRIFQKLSVSLQSAICNFVAD